MDENDVIEFVRVNTAAASTSSRALTVQASGVGAEGDDNAAERFDGVEVVQPLGLMASPTITTTTEAVCLRRGDELVAIALLDKGGAAQSVETGETRLYGVGSGNATAVIRIRADGSIDVTAKSAQAIRITASGGGDIVLNGGSLKVARVTDSVDPTAAMVTWMSQVAAAVNILAPGSVTPATPLTFATIAAGGGATNVKA